MARTSTAIRNPSRTTAKQRAEQLTREAGATARAAHDTGCPDDSRLLTKVAEEKRRQAANASRAVKVLPEHAPASEVWAARRRQAIQQGREVVLPAWHERCTGLPNVMLRSALFGLETTERAVVFDQRIESRGDFSLSYTGQTLTQFDKKVYLICLALHRDAPLRTAHNGNDWMRTSFNEVLRQFSRSDSPNSAVNAAGRARVRDSLLRLATANLRARTQGMNIGLPQLIFIDFGDDDAIWDSKTGPISGRDDIVFRIPADLAQLFGPGAWTATYLPRQMQLEGLALFLHDFFTTSSKGYWTDLEELRRLSGSRAPAREFRRMTRAALKRLQDPDLPGGAAIDEPEFREVDGEHQVFVTPRKPVQARLTAHPEADRSAHPALSR